MTRQPLDKEHIKEKVKSLLTELGLQHPRHTYPEVLFHYSSSHGLLGIMQSNKVWATNLKYMNDSSELSYTYDLAQEIISEMRSKEQIERVRIFFDCFEKYIKENNFYTKYLDVFAFCLCQEGDQLSQWREYSEKGTGFSIGFNAGLIANGNITRYGDTYSLIKVIYDKPTQRKYLTNIIARCMSELISLAKLAPDNQAGSLAVEFCTVLDACISTIAVQFKDAAFHEENEWRIVYIKPAIDIIDEIKFRASNRLIIPYIELDLSAPMSTYGNKLPITAIFQGPQNHPEIGKYSLSLLLKKHKFVDVDICQSSVPLRF